MPTAVLHSEASDEALNSTSSRFARHLHLSTRFARRRWLALQEVADCLGGVVDGEGGGEGKGWKQVMHEYSGSAIPGAVLRASFLSALRSALASRSVREFSSSLPAYTAAIESNMMFLGEAVRDGSVDVITFAAVLADASNIVQDGGDWR